MAEPLILGGVLKPVVEELATVYITQQSDGSYTFALTGDEDDAARTVRADQLKGWQTVQGWLQGELATAYRDNGF